MVALFSLLVCAPAKVCAAPELKSVRVLYLVPKDRAPRSEYIRAVERAVLELQAWYYGHLNGKTFRINNPIVEVGRTTHYASWYRRHVPKLRSEKRFYPFFNAMADAAAFGARSNDQKYIWLIYIDAPGSTAAGMKGIAVLPEHDLLGLAGRSIDGTPVSRWIGGSGHELGHALGLHHSGARYFRSLMQRGHSTYPACFFTGRDTAALGKSRFIYAQVPNMFRERGRYIYTYAGGFFIHGDGMKWQEIKTGTGIIYNYEVRMDDGRRLHLFDGSRRPGAWALLPKEGNGKDIYFKWEGGKLQKLYAAR